ncbi:MAG: hypothetical protein ACRDNW_03735, partial [Trebonia sp.]
DVLETLLPHRQPHIELSVFDNLVLAERLTGTIRPGLAGRTAFLTDKPDRTHGRGYYTGFALRVTADQGETELGDGGFTTWTAQLTHAVAPMTDFTGSRRPALPGTGPAPISNRATIGWHGFLFPLVRRHRMRCCTMSARTG